MERTREAASPTSRYDANVAKAIAFSAVSHFHLWLPFWVIYLRDLRGFSMTQILVLDSMFFIAQVLTEVPTGILADRYGRRAALVAGSVATALAVLVFGIADTYLLVFVSYLVWAVGATFISGADSALLYDSMKTSGRLDAYPRAQGWFMAAAPTAGLLGGLIGAPIAARTGMVLPILASAAFTAASAVIALSLREPPREVRSSTAGIARASLRHVRASAGIRYAIAFSAVGGAAATVTTILAQPFLVDHGAGLASLGMWLIPMRVAGITGSLAAHRLAIWLGEWRLFALSPFVLGLAFATLAGWDTLAAYAVFPVAWFVSSLRNPVIIRYANDRIPSSERASVLSLRAVAIAATIAVVEPLAGWVADTWSLRIAFAALAVFAPAALGLIVWGWWRVERRATAAST